MRKTIAILLTLGTMSASTAVHAVPMLFNANGHYYDYVAWPGASQSWTTANAAANASSFMGVSGHLATIANAGENAFVAGVASFGRAWIGLTDAAVEGNYQWVNGDGCAAPTGGCGYSNWSGGEPNDPTNAAVEDYVEMFSNGKWNDNANIDPTIAFRTTGYFVEYDVPVPAPLTFLLFGLGLVGLGARVKSKIG